MLIQRFSSVSKKNPDITEIAATASTRARGNAAIIRQSGIKNGVVLLGGNAIPHFRLRVAQAALRSDLLPSYWSMAAVLLDGKHLFSVPIDKTDGRGSVPETNAIQLFSVEEFDDARAFPNVAVIEYPVIAKQLRDAIESLQFQRSNYLFTDQLWTWLGYAWGVSKQANPLLDGIGIPCAQLACASFGMADVELVPGIAVGGATPEAIWASSLWWYQSYSLDQDGRVRGLYRLGQPAAAALGYKDRLVTTEIRPGPQVSPLRAGLLRKPRKSSH